MSEIDSKDAEKIRDIYCALNVLSDKLKDAKNSGLIVGFRFNDGYGLEDFGVRKQISLNGIIHDA